MGFWQRVRHLGRRKQATAQISWERAPSLPAVEQDALDADGRRHRTDAPYLLPKDDGEITRLDFQHYLLRQVLKGNCYAPVDGLLRHASHVLDVGCGTGRWGMEIATAYPQTQVCGFDLEDVPSPLSIPRNYQFHKGNVLNGLPFAAQSFHYVHQRFLVAGIPADKWPWVLRDLRRVTRPGGYIELVEMGNTFHHAGPATKQFLDWWIKISAARGIDAAVMARLGVWLEAIGLAHVQTDTKRLPVGAWGGRIGTLLAQNMQAGWPTMRPSAHTLLGVEPESFDAVMAALPAEWDHYHTTYEVYVACGQVVSV